MIEEWREVPGYEGYYSVSDRGNVRRDKQSRGAIAGRVMTAKLSTNGYYHVDLSRNDEKRRFRIHRIVASAFLGVSPFPKAVINHKDGNKQNNVPENLEWCTSKENNRHAMEAGLTRHVGSPGEKNGRAKLTETQVRIIRSLHGKISSNRLAALCNVARSLIQRIQKGEAWSHIDT